MLKNEESLNSTSIIISVSSIQLYCYCKASLSLLALSIPSALEDYLCVGKKAEQLPSWGRYTVAQLLLTEQFSCCTT